METQPNQEAPSQEIQGEQTNQSGRPLIQKIIFFVVIIVVLGLIGFLGYYFLTSKDQTNNSSPNSKKSSSTSAKPASARCSDKQEFTTKKQGYSVCFSAGWVSKQLKVSDIKVGFDPVKVDATTPGMIVVTISDKSENLSVQDIINNSLKYEYAKTTVDSARGTRITYDRTKEDPQKDFPKAIDIVLPKNDRSYTISFNSSEADYQTNLALFETFLEDFQFSEEEPSLPWAESRNILVYYPWPNDTIGSPVDVSGDAIAFEGVVNIRVKDDKNHTLAQTTVQAESGIERSAFAGKIDFEKTTSKKGFVEIFTLSTKDGSEQDKVTIPVSFQQ